MSKYYSEKGLNNEVLQCVRGKNKTTRDPTPEHTRLQQDTDISGMSKLVKLDNYKPPTPKHIGLRQNTNVQGYQTY